jgi:Fe-S oxidoreductase
MPGQNKHKKLAMKVNTMAEMIASGQTPEVLFWVGCAGSFDERAQKITKAVAKILHKAGINFAILGTEEACTGDPAKRAGQTFDHLKFPHFERQQLSQVLALLHAGGNRLCCC